MGKSFGLKFIILLLLYFMQGLPFGLQDKYLPVFYRVKGLDYSQLSLLKLVNFAWVCKIPIAVFVDKLENKKLVLYYTMSLLIIVNIIGSLIDSNDWYNILLILSLSNLFVAIQDVAVDLLAINILRTDELGFGNILQVVGYKVGMVLGGSVCIWICSENSLENIFFGMAAIQIATLFLLKNFIDFPSQSHQEITDEHSNKIQWEWREALAVPGTAAVISLILIYKFGDYGALHYYPLFLLDHHVPKATIDWWNGVVVQLASIIGSVIGGYIVSSKMKKLLSILWWISLWKGSLIFSLTLMIFHITKVAELYQTSPDSASDMWEYLPKLYIGFVILSALSFFSGIITTITFSIMMMTSKHAPERIRAFHYSVLATLETAGKLSFVISCGPLMNVFGPKWCFLLFTVLAFLLLPLMTCFLVPKEKI